MATTMDTTTKFALTALLAAHIAAALMWFSVTGGM